MRDCFRFSFHAGAQTIVVSPAGTLEDIGRSARRRSRATACRNTGPLTVRISDGVYYLSDTLVLTPEDSNTTWEAAPGARPVISGGSVIFGLEESQAASLDGGCHGTGIPAVVHQRPARAAGTDAQFRLLSASTVRARRTSRCSFAIAAPISGRRGKEAMSR